MPCSFEMGAYVGGLARVRQIEYGLLETGRHQSLERRARSRWPVAFRDTVLEFEPHDRRDEKRGARTQLRGKPSNDDGVTAVHRENDHVRVETEQ